MNKDHRAGDRRRVHVAMGTLVAAALAISTSVAAYEPGWYYGIETRYAQLDDSDGNTFVPGTPGTPATDAVDCALGNLLGLGSLLDLLGAVGSSGCLLGLLGPGVPGTDAIDPTQPQTLRTVIAYQDGFSGAFAVGYLFDGGLRPELSLTYAQNDWDEVSLTAANGAMTTSRSDNRVTALRLMGNLWYDLDFGGWAIPYFGAGLGYQNARISGDLSENDGGLAYQFGAGVGFVLNERMSLSLDYRYVTADDPEYQTDDGGTLQTQYTAQSAGIGLRYYFGGGSVRDADGDGVGDRKDRCPNTPAGVEVDLNGCAPDSDGDSVPDHRDQCPNTPAGVTVGADGCPLDADGDGVADSLDNCPGTPAGEAVGADGCPVTDLDGDGVPDFRDNCPQTPKGLEVGPDGCAPDLDGDGVPDVLDECPRTPPGAKVLPSGCALENDCRRPRAGEQVDENGCAVERSFILRGVKFEFDSDRLTAKAREILDEVAATLQAYPEIRVDLEGHTDDIGSDAYNLGLSERRAIAVKDYLVGHGVAAGRMHPVGYGESQPIESNQTEIGRDANRRVELSVLE
ncbi:MAG: OmpA family protein [Nevskiales bacterium]|nr:OmpA family protein [Nevskiales bacterium]